MFCMVVPHCTEEGLEQAGAVPQEAETGSADTLSVGAGTTVGTGEGLGLFDGTV